MTDSNQYDIIIVGFGLIGQICAKVCSQFNLKTLVIETRKSTDYSSLEISYDDESMRLLDNLELYCKIKHLTNRPEFTDIVLSNGRVIQRNPVLITNNGFPSISTFYQPDLEKVIREDCMHDENIDICYGNELLNFDSSDHEIYLTTRSGKKHRQFKTAFLLACDGANSFIKNKLNINTVDQRYSKNWLLVDIILKQANKLENVFRQICHEKRPISLISLSNMRYRFEFQLLTGEQHQSVINKSNLENLISNWIDPNNYEIENYSIKNFKGLFSKTFQKDNIFLIGEAAYQIPPYASQALNTGIRDIINLIWKINLIINYNCNKNLLLTYSSERILQVKETIKSSIALGQLIDSLSLAFQKNIPFEEAIAPEARDQAFGRKNNRGDNDTIQGFLFSSQVKNNFTKRLSNREITDKDDNPFLDKLIGNNFAIFSKKNIENKIEIKIYEKLVNLDFKFIHDYTDLNIGSELSDYLEIGEVLVRPDKKIFGISNKEFDINKLASDLLSQIQ